MEKEVKLTKEGTLSALPKQQSQQLSDKDLDSVAGGGIFDFVSDIGAQVSSSLDDLGDTMRQGMENEKNFNENAEVASAPMGLVIDNPADMIFSQDCDTESGADNDIKVPQAGTPADR